VEKISINEISRKVFHLFSSIVPLSYLYLVRDKDIMVMILAIASLFAFFIELLRKHNKNIEYLFNHWLGSMLKKNELKGDLTGATWLLSSWTITTYFFEMIVAVSALMFLAIGDSFAAIIGKLYPLGRIGKKTLSGSLAGFIVSFGIVILICNTLPPIVIFTGAFGAMFIELLPMKIDDNFTIPIFSGFIMVLVQKLI
tara:strand:- start:360 stop:953 length:594 start_codon:yes stop_codon:yes gene_type:complete